MIIIYGDTELETLILTHNSGSKKYRKYKSNQKLLKDLDKVMSRLRDVKRTSDLYRFAALHYEPLEYGLQGYSSVRIGFNSKYRLIFEELEEGIKIILIEISEHYGDK